MWRCAKITLEELFSVVSDEQDVILIGSGFDEVKAFKSTLDCVLTEQVLGAKVDCVEAAFDGDLKVWVKCDGRPD